MHLIELMQNLPGEELFREGLADVQSGRRTIPACLVEIARSRFVRAGLLSRTVPNLIPEPELHLYRLLCDQEGDAYSRYNSLIRELISFENALDRVISSAK